MNYRIKTLRLIKSQMIKEKDLKKNDLKIIIPINILNRQVSYQKK